LQLTDMTGISINIWKSQQPKCRNAGLALKNNNIRAVDCPIPSMYPLALIPA
jgi:hypothetical protein